MESDYLPLLLSHRDRIPVIQQAKPTLHIISGAGGPHSVSAVDRCLFGYVTLKCGIPPELGLSFRTIFNKSLVYFVADLGN